MALHLSYASEERLPASGRENPGTAPGFSPSPSSVFNQTSGPSEPYSQRIQLPATESPRLWQNLCLLQFRLANLLAADTYETRYETIHRQLSRVAVLLLTTTSDLAVAVSLYAQLNAEYKPVGLPYVRQLTRQLTPQALAGLEDLDECSLQCLLSILDADEIGYLLQKHVTELLYRQYAW